MSEALRLWREQLADYENDEALAVSPDQKFQIKKLIERAKAKIAELESTSGRTIAGPPREPSFDISRIDKYAPTELIGRETEMKLLNAAWDQAVRGDAKRPRVMTFVALGGEGKTSLVAKWVADLAGRGWEGCEGAFAWSFYSQGAREQAAVSSDLFLKGALEFFGDDDDRAFAGSNAGAFDKGQRLAKVVGRRRGVLILDGLEPLQYAPHSPTAGQLKDQGVSALLKGLATGNRGLCVVTTRYSVPDLRAYWQNSAPEHELKRLSKTAGVDLLRKRGVKGNQAEFDQLVEDVKGHALTLNLLGGFLKRAYHGDIRQRDRVKFEKADDKVQGGHAFRAIAAYERWLADESDESRRELAILKLLGLFDRPATADCIEAIVAAPAIPGLTEPLVGLDDEDWEFSLTGLQDAKLLTVNRDSAETVVSLDAHPLIREYFASRLRGPLSGKALAAVSALADENVEPAASALPLTQESGNAWREAHRRLYKHLRETTEDEPNPTLDDLQPLYQAVAHGCQAGLQQEACVKVYRNRILRGAGNIGFYSTLKLGAFGADLGAVACFFDKPWTRVSPALTESDQAWLLAVAAFNLRGLGRLIESLEPMRAGLPHFVDSENWKSAAGVANNLSELELTLGKVAEAVEDAERSVTYADGSGDAGMRMIMRTTHADALHQAGRRDESLELFREAEQMQVALQSQYPLLYSLQGFQYCDLLLTNAERARGK